MKPEELMIGNYFIDYSGDEKQFDLVDWEYYGEYELVNYCNPIPLDEQWLLDLGYQNHGSKQNKWFAKTYGKNGVSIIVYSEVYGKYAYQISKDYEKILTHVHTLQNLYFALTGQKLNKK